MAWVVSLFDYSYQGSAVIGKFYMNMWLLKFEENQQRNPKYPVFNHKDTGEALWLEGRSKPWVKSQLEIIDTRMDLFPHQNAWMPVSMVLVAAD